MIKSTLAKGEFSRQNCESYVQNAQDKPTSFNVLPRVLPFCTSVSCADRRPVVRVTEMSKFCL